MAADTPSLDYTTDDTPSLDCTADETLSCGSGFAEKELESDCCTAQVDANTELAPSTKAL